MRPSLASATLAARTRRVLLSALLAAVSGGLLSAAPATPAHATSTADYTTRTKTFDFGTSYVSFPPDVYHITVYVTGAGGGGGGGKQYVPGGGGGGGGTVRCMFAVTPYSSTVTVVVGYLSDGGYVLGEQGEDSRVEVDADHWAIGYGGQGGTTGRGGAGGAAGDCPGGNDMTSWAGAPGDTSHGYGHGGPGGWAPGVHDGCRYGRAGVGGSGGDSNEYRGYMGTAGGAGCVVIEYMSAFPN